jgi:hypothetical protein
MRVLSLLIACISIFCSICAAENIFVSAAIPDKKLILLNVEYLNKKYKIVDEAIFDVPFQVGNTAMARLQNGNYQVVWTAKDASNKIKLNSMIFDANLNKVGNIKKFGPVLSSHFNFNILDPDEQGISPIDSNHPSVGESLYSYSGLPEFVFVVGRNELTGAPLSKKTKLFQQPVGFRPNVTKFTCPSKEAEKGQCYYSSIGDIDTQRNGVLFGTVGNSNFTSGYVFNNNVLAATLCGVPGTDIFYFIHAEYGPNSVKFMNRKFNGSTGQPAGNLKPLTPTYSLYGGPFANYAAYGSLTSVSSISAQGGWHVLFIKPDPDGVNSGISVFHMNTQGNRDSQVQPLRSGTYSKTLTYTLSTTTP